MQTFIFESNDQTKSIEKALKLCREEKIDEFDISIFEQTEGSIGVEDVRNLQKKIFLKPLKSQTKAVIIKNSQNLTIEAQNALLKVLEEPPENTVIILTVANIDLLLSTILSRGKIIQLKKESLELLPGEIKKYNDLLLSLPSLEIGERLKLAESFSKNKDEAILWLEKMIIVARKNLIDDSSNNQLLNCLISFQKVHTILSTTNVNLRLTLENLFMNL
ncbi:MAG: hypothetical protein ABH816_03740 [Candidatus Levyibacteriota bacterium]